jgi:predicted TPR repeat methyltransferase
MNWAEMTPAEIREFYDRNMYMSLLDLSCETGLTVPELRKILLTDEED